MRHLLLVCDLGFNHSDSNIMTVMPLMSTFDLMLFLHELLAMPQIQRWKQQYPSLSEVCSDLSISCEQFCVLGCRLLTVSSGECVGPHVAFLMLKAFYVPTSAASNTSIMPASLQSFFVTSLCGWLELDPLDISYSLSSMPAALVDTLMHLVRSNAKHISGTTDVSKPRSVSISQQALFQSRINFYLLPSNLQIFQRWQLMLSSASSNVSIYFRFACSVQACVLAMCFPSISHSDISKKSVAFAISVVQFLLANCPLYNDEKTEQQMLQFCSSWLDIVYESSSKQEDQASPNENLPLVEPARDRKDMLLQLPRLDVVYETSPTHEASLVMPAHSTQQRVLSSQSVQIHSAFWAQCVGGNILQLLQVILLADGQSEANLQPCRLFLLQEMRSSGILLNTMNAFAFERYASPPEWLQELAAIVNGAASGAATQSAANSSGSTQTTQSSLPDKNICVFAGSAKEISNALSCRRRVMKNGSVGAPVFGPLEEIACTREMIRSIALISALGEPCVVAAGTNILAEIKLSPKGLSARRVAAPPPKSIESVVSSGLKKFGNSLFAKVLMLCVVTHHCLTTSQVYSIGSPTPAPTLFDDEGSNDNVTMISTSSWNCVCEHPTFPL